MIEADHEQLRQLFLNLLCNALDTLPQGGSIRDYRRANPVPRRDRATNRWAERKRSMSGSRSRSRTTGRGFPKDLGDRIFEPYVSTKETGIGPWAGNLPADRRLARRPDHRAPTPLKAAPSFTVRLPTSALSDQRLAEAPTEAARIVGGNVMSSLLIIDDEPNVCYSLQRALESATLKITTAGTAREGIESHPPRVRPTP